MKFSIISSLVVVFLSQSAFSQTCMMPMDMGGCTDSITQFYYDIDTDQCELFTYTGCGGNTNRFDTLIECETACLGTPMDNSLMDTLQYPADTLQATDPLTVDPLMVDPTLADPLNTVDPLLATDVLNAVDALDTTSGTGSNVITTDVSGISLYPSGRRGGRRDRFNRGGDIDRIIDRILNRRSGGRGGRRNRLSRREINYILDLIYRLDNRRGGRGDRGRGRRGGRGDRGRGRRGDRGDRGGRGRRRGGRGGRGGRGDRGDRGGRRGDRFDRFDIVRNGNRRNRPIRRSILEALRRNNLRDRANKRFNRKKFRGRSPAEISPVTTAEKPVQIIFKSD